MAINTEHAREVATANEIIKTETAQELAVTKRDKYLLAKEGVMRFVSRKANAMRTESNAHFSDYVDSEGNAATNSAMYNLNINKKITKLFGKSKDEMSELELQAVIAIDQDVAQAHETGIKNGLTRNQIKKNASRLCELGYENFKMKKQLLGINE